MFASSAQCVGRLHYKKIALRPGIRFSSVPSRVYSRLGAPCVPGIGFESTVSCPG